MKRTKYNARKTNGYDSAKEANRAFVLEAMEKAGKISDLKKQVEFVLIPAFYETIEVIGKRGVPIKPKKKCIERACSYIADFTYTENGQYIVEDSKGMRLPDYVIKRKLMLSVYGIKIKET